MDEYRQAQPVSGYPIKLPLGLKKLRSHDDSEIIRAYADILGSLMQPTDRPPVDHLKTHEFTSSLAIDMLTLNHGNLTKVYNMPMKDRPIVKMMMQNSAHILCLNEADAFFWNYWQDIFSPGVRIGEPHSECSDVSSAPRKVTLILNTKFRPRTAWQLRDHSCSLNPRSTLDRDCQHAPLCKDTAETKRLSFSISSRVMSFVACSRNQPTNHSSSLTTAT